MNTIDPRIHQVLDGELPADALPAELRDAITKAWSAGGKGTSVTLGRLRPKKNIGALSPTRACDRPAACPCCGTMSRRAVTAPTILGMDARIRNAHMRNEKSAHEPRVVRADDWKPHGDHAHAHGATDGHGSHLHQSSRPWMIGH